MGYGHVLRDLPIDAGLAVALTDPRNFIRKLSDALHGVDVIGGDILSGVTWGRMSQWLRDHKSNGFDLILFRPLVGIKSIPHDYGIYYTLLQKVWDRTTPEGGIILAQLPAYIVNIEEELSHETQHQAMQNWVSLLNNQQIEASYHNIDQSKGYWRKTLSLQKNPNSPTQIPRSDFPKSTLRPNGLTKFLEFCAR